MQALNDRLSRREFLQAAMLAMAGSVLAACAPKPAEAPTAVPTAAQVEATKAEPTAEPTAAPTAPATAAPQAAKCEMDWTPTYPAFEKYNPPVQISTIFEGGAKFIGQDTLTDNPMYNRMKDQLGVEYTVHWTAAGDEATQKMNADVAAGTLADLFCLWSEVDIEKFIQNDAIEEISAIWEKTASPLVKEKRPRDHPMWVCVTRGDKLYGVPWTNGPAFNIAHLLWVRQDWLDKLGLQMPTTVNEIDQTMRAFVKAGLAKFGICACKRLVTWLVSLDSIFGAYGLMPTAWRPDGKGGLEYGSINPGVQEVLGIINQWYKDGLIDPDFYTYDEYIENLNHVTSSRIGLFFAPYWHWFNLRQALVDNLGMQFSTGALPKGPDGKQGRKDSGDHGHASVFRKGVDPAKIEAAIKQLNWSVEMHVNWQKYQQYGEWLCSCAFAEGYEWVFNDKCDVIEGPIDNTYPYMNGVGFNYPTMCYPSYQADPYGDLLKWWDQDPATLNKAQRFLMSNPIVKPMAEGYVRVASEANLELPDLFYGVPTQNMLDLLPELRKMEDEALIEFVTGKRPLSAFDDFAAEWKKSGGDTVTADVNAWYAAQKA